MAAYVWFQQSLLLLQTAWYVDAVNGDDGNPGTAALPLLTLAELQLRFERRRLVADTTITLIGTFAEALILNCVIPQNVVLSIEGATTTQQYAGVIGAFTALLAPGTPASIQDAGLVAANHITRRFRMTNGAAAGAIAWGLKDVAADTERISQFIRLDPTQSSSAINPANGDAYVVETLDTSILRYHLALDGLGSCYVKSLKVNTAPTGTSASVGNVRPIFTGCTFPDAISFTDTPTAFLRGCQFESTATVAAGFISIAGCAAFNTLSGASSNSTLSFIGAGTCFQVGTLAGLGGGRILNTTDLAFFDGPNSGNQCSIFLRDFSSYSSSAAAGKVWTVNPLQQYGIRVGAGSFFQYYIGTKPTATGVVNDTYIGAVAQAYGAIPYVNPANNAMMVVWAV